MLGSTSGALSGYQAEWAGIWEWWSKVLMVLKGQKYSSFHVFVAYGETSKFTDNSATFMVGGGGRGVGGSVMASLYEPFPFHSIGEVGWMMELLIWNEFIHSCMSVNAMSPVIYIAVSSIKRGVREAVFWIILGRM